MNQVVSELLEAAKGNNINQIAKTIDDDNTTYHFSFLNTSNLIENVFDVVAVRFQSEQVVIYMYDGRDLIDGLNISLLEDERYFYIQVITDREALDILKVIETNKELIEEIN